MSYGDKDANIHTPTEDTIFTVNDNGTHSYTCACGTAVAEVPHTLDVTTGKCVCGADMTAIATVTDGTNTYYAADAEAGMITAIRRAICDTEGVADGSIWVNGVCTHECGITHDPHTFENGICTVCGMAEGPVELAITQQPTDSEAKLGENYCVEVIAQGEGLTYQWYFRNAGTDVWHKSGVTDNTYDDIMTKARAGRQVYCVITDAWGNTVTTETATLIAK